MQETCHPDPACGRQAKWPVFFLSRHRNATGLGVKLLPLLNLERFLA
jgi:hypothetical protein